MKKISFLIVGLALLSWPALSFPAACDDGIDNDGNGYTDYPADLDCMSILDTSESSAPTLVGTYDTTGTADDVYVVGNLGD